jgi:hypothetical protein
MLTSRQRAGVLRRIATEAKRPLEHVGGIVAALELCLPLSRDEANQLRPAIKALRARVRRVTAELAKLERIARGTKKGV